MSDLNPDDVPASMLRSIQIVVGTLVAGVVMIAMIAFAIRMGDPAALAPDPPLISYLALASAPVMLAVRAMLMPILTKAGRSKLQGNQSVTIQQVMEQFSARTITGSALLEGSAFFLLVAYLAEGRLWTLAGGLLMAALLAALQFPTRARVALAIAADLQAIEDVRAGM